MEVFTDSSFGDCEDSKSTSGYIIKIFDDTVAWRSKKQTLVTRSTCGAEYYAAIFHSDRLKKLYYL
ncbi:unnamed protein product [Trichogramma brassicae]|uniref:Uncharacterized protein n=1 Tax=Trichogramma brassicae TaxID=86971 RepID=A0A6H5IXB6_9HYME|nr:unnamed protein product [Trichogramma brassicae]